jgi:alpha-beta hydrolase superfamily lysophospholipase
VEHFSRDKDVVENYKNDPLVHSKISLKMIISLLDAASFALKNASIINLPVLLMHGSSDQITDPEGSRQFAASNPDKCTLKIWEGLYHEMYNEPEKEEVFNYLMNWINKLL